MSMRLNIEEIASVPIDFVVGHFGLSVRHTVSTDKYIVNCPFHVDTSKPNLNVDNSKNSWYCFVCGFGGGPLQFVGHKLFGESYTNKGKQVYESAKYISESILHDSITKEPLKYTSRVFNKKPDAKLALTDRDIDEFVRNMDSHRKYYVSKVRGITNFKYFRFGAFDKDIRGSTIRFLTIPMYDHNGNLFAVKCRNTETNLSKDDLRYYMFPGSSVLLPHVPARTLYGYDTVFFVEDSLSAISLLDMGYPAVSLAGGNSINQNVQVDVFKAITDSKNVIVVPDNDGKDGSDSCPGDNLYKSMEARGITYNKICRLPDPYKDINDFYVADKRSAYNFVRSCWHSNGD